MPRSEEKEDFHSYTKKDETRSSWELLANLHKAEEKGETKNKTRGKIETKAAVSARRRRVDIARNILCRCLHLVVSLYSRILNRGVQQSGFGVHIKVANKETRKGGL